MKKNFRENLEKAIVAKERCDGPSQYCTISVEDNWQIKIYANPSNEDVHKTVAAMVPLLGSLKKKADYFGSLSFIGANEFFDISIKTPEQCKIVGYKIEKRPKMLTVQTAEIETVRVPVTDCDFQSGKVKAGEFEPIAQE